MTSFPAPDEHAWAATVIPWHVNETLETQHRARLENHLQHCAECRDTVAHERKLMRQMRSGNPVEYTSHGSLKKLHSRIDKFESAKKRPRRWRARFVNTGWLTPLALTAQATAIAILALTLWSVLPATSPTDNYQTMSGATRVEADVQIVFAKDVTTERILELVADLQGVIARGPSEGGLYEIALNDHTPKNIELVVQQLRSRPEVVFATARSNGTAP